MTVEASGDGEKGETDNFVVTHSDLPVVESSEEPKKEEAPAKPVEGEKDDPPKKEAGEVDKDKGEAPTGESSDSDAPAGQGDKKHRSAQKRIDKVVREREDEKRGREAALRENADLKKQLEAKSEPEPKKLPEEPKQSDFESYDQYLDALDSHAKEVKAAEPEPKPSEKAEPKAKPDQNDDGMTDSQRTAMAITKEKVSDATDRFEDFEKVALAEDVPINGEMLEALAECDDPAKVMYHLGLNKDIAAKIAEKSPAQIMRDITKLDLTVDTKPPKPTKTTNADAPISPVAGSDAQEKKLEEMSFKEYEETQNKAERTASKGW